MAFFNSERRSGPGNGPKKFGKGGPDRGRGGRGGFAGRPDRGGREEGGRSMMFEAVCSQCQRDCQVPFRPNGRKPVLCSTCFGKQVSSGASFGGGKSFGGDRAPRQFNADRPARPASHSSSQPTENYRAQFEMLNSKLDRILNMLLAESIPASTPRNLDLDDEIEVEGEDGGEGEEQFLPLPVKIKKAPKAAVAKVAKAKKK